MSPLDRPLLLDNPLPPEQADNHDGEEIDLNVRKPHDAWVLLAAIAAVILLATMLICGWIPRSHRSAELNGDAADARNAPVVVNIAHPRRAPAELKVKIPGTLRPWQEVSIFARTTGYLACCILS